MLDLSTQDFTRLVTYIKSTYGIDLTQKKQLIVGRLTNSLTSMGYTSFKAYIDDVLRDKKPKDLELVLNKLTTNYTYFYREGAHFDYLRDKVLPELEKTKKNKVINIWSAGCSSGQEPYTLAMILKEHFGNKGWDIKLLATDISQNALSTAIQGVYKEDSLDPLPADWKQKYFKKTSEPGFYQVSDVLRNSVVFKTFNLMEPIRFNTKFDVIFCRNVMIYFDQPTKDALIQRFYDVTERDGYLFIGHSESFNRSVIPYKYIMPAAYRKV